MALSPVTEKARILLEIIEETNQYAAKRTLLNYLLSNKQIYRQQPFIIQFLRRLRAMKFEDDYQRSMMKLIEDDIRTFNQLNPSLTL